MSGEIPMSPAAPGVYAENDDHKLWSDPAPDRGVLLQQSEGGKCTPSDGVSPSRKGMKGVRECRKRAWPEYLVFFEQLEPLMTRALEGSQYRECTRLFNSHAHDDWRRKGDVVVWCLFPDRVGNVPDGRVHSEL